MPHYMEDMLIAFLAVKLEETLAGPQGRSLTHPLSLAAIFQGETPGVEGFSRQAV